MYFGAVDDAVLAKRAGEPRLGVVSFVKEDSILAALGTHALDGVWFTVSRRKRKFYRQEASAGTSEDLAVVTSVLTIMGGRASLQTLGVALTGVPLTGFSSVSSFLRSHPTLFSLDPYSDVVVLESSSANSGFIEQQAALNGTQFAVSSSSLPDMKTLAWLGDRACLLYIALLGTEHGLTANQMDRIATRRLNNASLANLPSSADGAPSATQREAHIGRAVAGSRQTLLANLDEILEETDPVLHSVLNKAVSSVNEVDPTEILF